MLMEAVIGWKILKGVLSISIKVVIYCHRNTIIKEIQKIFEYIYIFWIKELRVLHPNGINRKQ